MDKTSSERHESASFYAGKTVLNAKPRWKTSGGSYEIQYLEVKHLFEIQARYRQQVREMVSQYRRWKRAYQTQDDLVERVYSSYEGVFMRRQIEDAWKMYRIISADAHELMDGYLRQLAPKFPKAISVPTEMDRAVA